MCCTSFRRKSAEDNLMTEGVVNAAPELGFPIGLSEERVADAGNMDKVRRKSTPRYGTLLCQLFFFSFFLVHGTTLR